MMSIISKRRSLLVIGHPGHELRLYGWIGQAQPLVCVLTDGSGSDGMPRLAKTLQILRTLKAEIGPVFGELSDREIYEKVLRHEYALFDTLCEQLVRILDASNIDMVVSDAIEGYNPIHDLCEVLVRTAVAIASNRKHRSIRRYTIPLMGDPRESAGHGDQAANLVIDLTSLQFIQKLESMRDYARSAGQTLQQEVEGAFHTYGEQAFAREYLFAAPASGHEPQEPEWRFTQGKPFYETYGEERVATGRYQSVIRFHEHILPLVNRLREKVLADISSEVRD
jgi:hypothetical protein